VTRRRRCPLCDELGCTTAHLALSESARLAELQRRVDDLNRQLDAAREQRQ
jgi:hypothetical protein